MFQSDATKALQQRYKMDAEIWKSSQRGGLFKVSLNSIVAFCFFTPVLVYFAPFGKQHEDFEFKLIGITLFISLLAFYVSQHLIVKFKDTLCKKNLFGKDLNKAGDRESKEKVPEALGLMPAVVFLLVTINEQLLLKFTNEKLVEYNAALLSICMMVMLGFMDDVMDLAWRYKFIVPTIATFPLLVAYGGDTSVVVPRMLRAFLGPMLNVGFIYYLYMGNLAVFCTNSINIYAGMNGLEVGQSVVIGSFILIHNIIEMKLHINDDIYNHHLFSLTLMVPFLFTTLALLRANSFPSRVFVGDTFCYFAGMTFAVVGILGHFSKTMLLFFIPQIINFILSFPQLIGVVHCPRHRLPSFNHGTYQLECVHHNYTNINAFLRLFGPTNEQQACNVLLLWQILCCLGALFLRYAVAEFFF